MKTILAAALLAATSGAALADDVTLSAPLTGATLHEGPVDMSVYWTDKAEVYEVVATYLTGLRGEEPARLVLLMQDGDRATLGLPGAPGYHFTFQRSGDQVMVSTHAYGAPLTN
ncbi:hypothetical protein [Maliponia aquimaris]|uniref:Uncharacterized protein n=1 Tax=Maliponia aquimaris TaxID=1673631 RepID=A0A238L7I1_9RHOB|nr:hypothetical protein [Maliponia aquimaris]SMX50256.1 hypothetical protein MAA8898_04679 [Maliponia aquimaris]